MSNHETALLELVLASAFDGTFYEVAAAVAAETTGRHEFSMIRRMCEEFGCHEDLLWDLLTEVASTLETV